MVDHSPLLTKRFRRYRTHFFPAPFYTLIIICQNTFFFQLHQWKVAWPSHTMG